MRILILGINFFPELTSTGRYTGEMAAYLAGSGLDVRVVTAPPYYPYWKVQAPYRAWAYSSEVWQGVRVYRCPLWVPARPSGLQRVLHLLSFALSSLPVLLGQIQWRPDIVLCVVPAFFTAPSALLFSKWVGAKTWIHIQDFELDAATRLRMLPVGRAAHSLAGTWETSILSRFDCVSTISENMVKHCLEKGVPEVRVRLLPNWVDTRRLYPMSELNPLRAQLNIPSEKVIVLYHGNMGRKQGLGLLIEAARCLADKDQIAFVMCGDGVARPELEEQARGLRNVFFLPIQPEERLNLLINLADIHVLPQLAGAADLVMPSKLGGMLASGRPVVACAEPGTQVWKVVRTVGKVVPPEDAAQLADILWLLANNPKERASLGRAARQYAEDHLERERILRELLSWLPGMARGSKSNDLA